MRVNDFIDQEFATSLNKKPSSLFSPDVDECTHLRHVQTQWDLLVVHVTVLPAGMAELAIYHQVINWPNITKMFIY